MNAIEAEGNYTERIAIRITAAEKKQLERKAQAAGKSFSEWSREMLLGTVRFAPDYRALLAEFLAQRMIVLALLSELANRGRAPLPEAVRAIVQEAESSKFSMADERIVKYLHGEV